MHVGSLCVLLLVLASEPLVCSIARSRTEEKSVSAELKLKYNNDIACSYMGAWLAHVNLFRRVPFFMDICRAEAASIDLFKATWIKFVTQDPNHFYVNHLSAFEHASKKHFGEAEAQRRTQLLSQAAYQGECEAPDSLAEMGADTDSIKR
mmetsp:Transcript_33369/g.73513  ORF Transcript_33369/g.73513 Transcript_33369/m.73513 type:complete len:150 (+) Transcript_33369:84-533(+)